MKKIPLKIKEKNLKLTTLGFTLIELLAVILILGIIALIAIPTVNKIIEESRMGAFESTLNNINKKVKETCTLEQMKNLTINTHYVISNGKASPALDLKGDLPDGDIYVDNNCNVTYTLNNKTFIGTKDDPKQKPIIEKCPNGKCPEPPVLISKDPDKSKSYVGYYADVDGDGTVDGVIFADLVTGAIGSGKWVDDYGIYTIPTISSENSKDYYISKTEYSPKEEGKGEFPKNKVITLAKNTTGSERFYVMSLTDVSTNTYCWYDDAFGKMSDYATYTSRDFGSGRENTTKMITKWDADGYGGKDIGEKKDIWGEIKPDVSKGWFVPSRGEWAAFVEELNSKLELDITKDTYTSFNLKDYYWASSQWDTYFAYSMIFGMGYMKYNYVIGTNFARLAATF